MPPPMQCAGGLLSSPGPPNGWWQRCRFPCKGPRFRVHSGGPPAGGCVQPPHQPPFLVAAVGGGRARRGSDGRAFGGRASLAAASHPARGAHDAVQRRRWLDRRDGAPPVPSPRVSRGSAGSAAGGKRQCSGTGGAVCDPRGCCRGGRRRRQQRGGGWALSPLW